MTSPERCRTGIFKLYRSLTTGKSCTPDSVDKELISRRYDQDARENDLLGLTLLLVIATGIAELLFTNSWLAAVFSIPLAWIALHFITAAIAWISKGVSPARRPTMQHFLLMSAATATAIALSVGCSGLAMIVGVIWLFLIAFNGICWIAWRILQA